MSAIRFVHLTGARALREQSHRRITLVALALLLVLSTSPVYVHHLFALSATQVLSGIDHLGALCLTALHLLLQPVHRVFHVVIIAGVSYAVWDRLRAWRAVRKSLLPLEQREPAPGDPFWRAALTVGANPRHLRVVTGLPNPAFTVGLLKPRVYLAQELSDTLPPEQLAAVIAHEGAHVARRDPLRLFLLRVLAHTVFWIPALRRLADDVADEAEVLADDIAARDRPLVLASAILALAGWGERTITPATAVGFQRDALLERRVRRLAGEEVPVESHLTRRSVLGAVLALSVVWSSGVVMAHPLPYGAHSHVGAAHCEHHDLSAVAHLFCLGSPLSRTLYRQCPHSDS